MSMRAEKEKIRAEVINELINDLDLLEDQVKVSNKIKSAARPQVLSDIQDCRYAMNNLEHLKKTNAPPVEIAEARASFNEKQLKIVGHLVPLRLDSANFIQNKDLADNFFSNPRFKKLVSSLVLKTKGEEGDGVHCLQEYKSCERALEKFFAGMNEKLGPSFSQKPKSEQRKLFANQLKQDMELGQVLAQTQLKVKEDLAKAKKALEEARGAPWAKAKRELENAKKIGDKEEANIKKYKDDPDKLALAMERYNEAKQKFVETRAKLSKIDNSEPVALALNKLAKAKEIVAEVDKNIASKSLFFPLKIKIGDIGFKKESEVAEKCEKANWFEMFNDWKKQVSHDLSKTKSRESTSVSQSELSQSEPSISRSSSRSSVISMSRMGIHRDSLVQSGADLDSSNTSDDEGVQNRSRPKGS